MLPNNPPSRHRRLLLTVVALVVTLGVGAAVGFAFSSSDDDDRGGALLPPSPSIGSTAAGAPASTPAVGADPATMDRLCPIALTVAASSVPAAASSSEGRHDDGDRISAGCAISSPLPSPSAGRLDVEAAVFVVKPGGPSPEAACRAYLGTGTPGADLKPVTSAGVTTYVGVSDDIVRTGTAQTCVGNLYLDIKYSLTRYRPAPILPLLADTALTTRTLSLVGALAQKLL